MHKDAIERAKYSIEDKLFTKCGDLFSNAKIMRRVRCILAFQRRHISNKELVVIMHMDTKKGAAQNEAP